MKEHIKITEKRRRILKRSKTLLKQVEDLTETKIEIDEDVSIEGESFAVYQTVQVIRAYGRGFDIRDALNLLDDNYGLEIINLPDFVSTEKRMTVLKSRIIGSHGKTKKAIEDFTDTKLAVQGKTVSILGEWDKINVSKEAVMMLINGSSHKTVYRWLEKNAVVKA
jgi:ribosomal RNA assembly protein